MSETSSILQGGTPPNFDSNSLGKKKEPIHARECFTERAWIVQVEKDRLMAQGISESTTALTTLILTRRCSRTPPNDRY